MEKAENEAKGIKKLDVVSVRLVKDRTLRSTSAITSPKDVIELVSKELGSYDREVCCVLSLNTKKMPVNMSIVAMGGINYCNVEMREIFKVALLSNAAGIIFMHNHPSGDVLPSNTDWNMFKGVVVNGTLLGIPVLDCIICGRDRYYSCHEKGLLENIHKAVGKKMKKVFDTHIDPVR